MGGWPRFGANRGWAPPAERSSPPLNVSRPLPFFDSWKPLSAGVEGTPGYRREEHPGERSGKPFGQRG